jgi:Ni,Fe-hydrogenase III large subunit
MPGRVLHLRNGEAVETAAIRRLPLDEFQGIVADAVTAGHRVSAYVGDAAPGEPTVVTGAIANDALGTIGLLSTRVEGPMASLAAECPSLQLFERELVEQLGVVVTGHPWPRAVRFEPPRASPGGTSAPGAAAAQARPTLPGDHPFFVVDGEEVHEVAVGPVHAGIIEPGHFRFQCHGENVLHLEIVLGYQHRGVERLLEGGPTPRTLAVAESIAGDTAVGHAIAYARAIEGLAGVAAPPRAAALRAVALELERLANHVGDLGALAMDIGFLPTASFCGALRAEFLNALAELCGNRFGRGLVVPGGVRRDLPDAAAERLADRLEQAWQHVVASTRLFFRAASVRNRTDGTGRLSPAVATQLGLVGPAARACGVRVDVRETHPFPPYDVTPVPLVGCDSGDVTARARVRRDEAERSAAFILGTLRALPRGPVLAPAGPARADATAVSLVEGWRGEICHVVRTGTDGRIARYKVVDPSFHNWMGLQLAVRGQQVSDFPLCNKSFNLSYCGHDL